MMTMEERRSYGQGWNEGSNYYREIAKGEIGRLREEIKRLKEEIKRLKDSRNFYRMIAEIMTSDEVEG